MNKSSKTTVFQFVWSQIKGYKGALAVMILVAITWAADISLRPYILKILIDRGMSLSGDAVFSELGWIAALYASLTLIMSTVFRLYGYYVDIHMIPPLRTKIGTFMFTHVTKHSHQFFLNKFAGSLANKINDLIKNTPELVQIITDRFLSISLALIFALVTLWSVQPIFAIALFCWLALIGGLSLWKAPLLHKQATLWGERGSQVTAVLVDVLTNMLAVRLFTSRRSETKLFTQTAQGAQKAEQAMERSFFWIWFTYGYTFFIFLATCLYFLLKGRAAGTLTSGDFALVLGISISVADFFWILTKEGATFLKATGRIAQALEETMDSHDIVNAPDAKPLQFHEGSLRFENVHFHYKGTEALFKNKTVEILAGQKVGLVGYSGSGKTTFVNLILRLYDVTGGRITVDGQDIRHVTQDSLHNIIAMIPQDPTLFHRSIQENIQFARPSASEEEVVAAAKAASAHAFIETLPLGYASMVGERGVKLSGGQRQRIAIARAFLKNAPILILDEATSQLDSVTEQSIQETLWMLMQDKTTLVIAHRLSTLLHMDRLLVFDQGRIVQDGHHTELLQQEGHYKTLWQAQIGGFLPE